MRKNFRKLLVVSCVIGITMLAPVSGQAGILYSYVQSAAQGEVHVSGLNDATQSKTSNATGPFNATASGTSGSGANIANFTASVSSNLSADFITGSGNSSWGYSVADVSLLVAQASSSVIAHFTVDTTTSFTLNGFLDKFSFVEVFDETTHEEVILLNNTTLPRMVVAESGTLKANYLYDLQFESGAGSAPQDPGQAFAFASGYNLTLTASSSVVPEPSSFALLGLGCIGFAIGAYRRRRAETAY